MVSMHGRRLFGWWLGFALATMLMGCSDSDDSSDGGGTTAELLANPCDDALDSVYVGREPEPSWDSEMRGDVTSCAFERRVSIAEMEEAFMASDQFIDPGISTAVDKYRLQYWMERNPGEPVLTSAVLYIPETRRADPSPVVVLGHGSVGVADQCAPSLEDPEGFNTDWRVLAYTYAGDGWISIMPDNPGLGTPGTTTYLYSIDEGHAILDATRAVRKLFNAETLTDKNALIGHSAGGHAVLSAQAFAADYGHAGTLETVIPINPFWYSLGAFGVLTTELASSLADSALLSMGMQYFMGHLAAYEGEDHVLDAFLPEMQEPARKMLESGCWDVVTTDEAGPPSIGVTSGPDLFTAEYVSEVGVCGITDNCETELARQWRSVWTADRPPPDEQVPIYHWTGAFDQVTPPSYQKCGVDRLLAQRAVLTTCVQSDGTHSGTVPRMAEWARQHLEAVLLDGNPPEPCETFEESFPDITECGIPIIPNSLDPSDP